MVKSEAQLQKQQMIQNEMMKKQQQIMQQYRKRLNGKNLQLLQNFAQSGKQVGSSDFLKLPPIVQEVLVKMQTSSMDIMSKNTKNPLKKIQLFLAKLATTQMSKVAKKERKKK